MKVSIIVAISQNDVIGNNNDLLWNIPRDLTRFKKITTNHVVIMGRKTYESLPIKPLPNRTNIVITSDMDYNDNGIYVAHNIDEALEIAIKYIHDDEIFVIGGGEIYKQFLPLCNKIYLTKIHEDFEGDTYFPEIDMDKFKIEYVSKVQGCDEYTFTYYILTSL